MSNNTQLEKLQRLQKNGATKQASSMKEFEGLIGIYLGTEPTEHFPKVLDAFGRKIKVEKDGRTVDKRAEESDGWTYTFAEFVTCKKISIVLPRKYDLKLMTAYSLSGSGYDIKSGNMYFIEKNGDIGNY